MAISDEVIELAPVKKTKTTLIILLVAIGVAVALAVTFLVMYLLKPAPEGDNTVVNDVSITTNTLFSSRDDSGNEVLTASIGNAYTVSAKASVENGTSENISWEISPREAVIGTQISEDTLSFSFTPNAGYDGEEVTIIAKSAAKGEVVKEIKFKVVDQKTEYLFATKYYADGTDSSRAPTVAENKLSIPYYTVNDNNKNYTMLFDQKGEYNELLDVYAELTDEEAEVTATSGDTSVLSIIRASYASVTFKAVKKGSTTINLTVNSGKTFTFNVTVQSSEDLKYIENIYFFDKAIVDKTFIEEHLTADNKLDIAKLTTEFGGSKPTNTEVKMNSGVFTLPLSNDPYANIFDHILIYPINIQYDAAKKDFQANWQSHINITSTVNDIVRPDKQTAQNSAVVNLVTRGLGAATLTFEDSASGSVKTNRKVLFNVVAGNQTGSLAVQSYKSDGSLDSTKVGDNGRIGVVPDQKMLYTVSYTLTMPGDTDVSSVIDKKLMNLEYMLEFEDKIFEVCTDDKYENKLKSNEKKSLTKDNVEIARNPGGSTSSTPTAFTATIKFYVAVNANADTTEDSNLPYIKFTKYGTTLSLDKEATTNNRDAQWSKTVNVAITAQAKDASLIDNSNYAARNLVTNNNNLPGDIIYNKDSKGATIYVQRDADGEPLPFNVYDLVTAKGECKKTVSLDTRGALRASSLEGVKNVEGDKIVFTNTDSNAKATVSVTVSSMDGKPLDTFTFDIYVINGVRSFALMAEQNVNYGYNNSNNIACDSSMSANNAGDRYVFRYYSNNPTNATYYKFAEMELYYGAVGTSTVFRRVAKSSGSIAAEYYYDYIDENDDKKSEPFFDYDGVYLTPKVDLYEKSLKFNADFTQVFAKFTANPNDYYAGKCINEEAPSVTKTCKFTRKADSVAVYTDSSYADDFLLVVDNSTEHNFNQNSGVYFYATSVVKYKDGTVIPVKRYKNDYLVEDARITLPNGITEDDLSEISTPKTGSGYYSFKLSVPSVTDTDKGDLYKFRVATDSTNNTLLIRAQNKSRGVASVGLYEDKNCTTQISSAKVFSFGEFNKDSLTSKTVYVKVTYVGYPTGNNPYVNFEKVLVTVPDFLTANVTSFTPASSIDRVYGANEYESFTLTVTLKSNYNEAKSGVISVDQEQQPNGGNWLKATCNASVDTGLASVSVIDGGNTSTATSANGATVEWNVTVSKAADFTDGTAKEKVFTLSFASLMSSMNYNRKADKLGCTISPSTYAGISIGNGVFDADGASISFKLNGITEPINKATITVTFTDKTNGATTTFTVVFEITVTVDVYEVTFDNANAVVIATTGEAGESETSTKLHVTINDNVTPNDNGLDVSVVNTDGSTAEGLRAVYEKDADTDKYTQNVIVYVKNSIITEKTYKVVVSKGGVKLAEKAFTVKTTATHITLDSTHPDVDVTTIEANKKYTASITVTPEKNTFRLAAAIVNGKDGQTYSVTYTVFDETFNTALTGVVSVDSSNNGVFTVTPNARTGKFGYRMTYTGSSDKKPYTIDVVVTYTVPTSVNIVTLNNLPSAITENGAIVLYFNSASVRTTFDLASYIGVTNAFDIGGEFTERELTTSSNGILNFNGTTIVPIATTSGVKIRIKVGDAQSAEYTVIVRSIDEFVVTPSVTEIDKTDAQPITLTNSLAGKTYYGLKYEYTITAPAGFTVSGDKTTVTLDTPAPANGTYRFSVGATFTMTSGITGLAFACPTFEKSNGFNITVNSDSISADFDLTCGANTVDQNQSHFLGVNEVHKVTIKNKKENVTYALTISNNVVTMSKDFANGVAEISVTGNDIGEFTLTVTATYYGEIVSTVDKTYNFVRVGGITAELKYGSGSAIDLPSGDTIPNQKIDDDFSKKFTYTVSNVPAGATLDLHAYGEGVTSSLNGSVLTITVTKPTTLVVYGTVTVGTDDKNQYFVYLPTHKVNLTATAPAFNAKTDKTTLNLAAGTALPTATLSVEKASGFNGNYTVEYTLLSGGDYATLTVNDQTKTATLIAKSMETDGTVKVAVKATVTSGAYNGLIYTKEITVNVTGVALPTLDLSTVITSTSITEGGTISFTLPATLDNYSVTYNVNAVPDNGVNCNLTNSGNTYTLELNDVAPAGGKIKINVTATIGGAVHTGKTITATREIIIADPRLANVTGALLDGSYSCDLTDLIKPRYNDGEGHFVKSWDTFTINTVKLGATELTDKIFHGGSTTESATVTVDYTMNSGYYQGKTFTYDITVSFVQPVTVTFDYNANGENTATTVLYKSGSTYNTNWFTPNRKWFTFDGWYLDGTKLSGSETVTAGATLTAHWTEPATVKVTLKNGYSTSGNVEKTFTYGSAYGSDLSNITRTGYTFDGWYTDDGRHITSSTIVTDNSDHNLTARWVANSYTVTLYNGNTVFATVTVVYGKEYGTLPSAPDKNFYNKFQHWSTSSGNNGTIINSSTIVENANNHSLYAKFSRDDGSDTVTVRLYTNQTGSDSTVYESLTGIVVGSTYTGLDSKIPTRTDGYRFDGWYTARTGGTKIIESSLVNDGVNALYAHWVKTYTVTLYSNYGTENSNKGDVVYTATVDTGSEFTRHMATTATRPDYKFIGWYTTRTTTTAAASVITVTSNVELFAKWEVIPTSYTVTLKLNGGNVAGSTADISNTVSPNGTFDPNSTTPTYDGYTFIGWFTKATGGNQINEAVTVTADVEFYAHWQLNPTTFTVTLDANGGTINGSRKYTQTLTAGEKFNLHNYLVPVLNGQRFVGWFDDNGEVTGEIETTTTLTAHWETIVEPKEQVTVTFIIVDDNGAVTVHSVKTMDKGSKLGALPVLNDGDDYTYGAWSITNEETVINANTVISIRKMAKTTTTPEGNDTDESGNN